MSPPHFRLPGEGPGPRYWLTSLYLVVMASLTFLAVIFDWTW